MIYLCNIVAVCSWNTQSCALNGSLNLRLFSFIQLPFYHLRQVKTRNILFCGLISFSYYHPEVNPVTPLWLFFVFFFFQQQN